MSDLEYSNACSEVSAVLQNLSLEDLNKIPSKEIEHYKKHSNKDYIFNYNSNLTNLSKEAKAILLIIFRDYFANDIQKNKMIEIIENKIP